MATVLPKKELLEQTRTLLSALGCDAAELSILVTDDKEIQKLNFEYRKKNKPTDVLSFALTEGIGAEFSNGVLGDVVISLETALKQAKHYRVTPTREFQRLLVHGLLHLLGYDHENVSARKRKQMEREEDRLLGLLSPGRYVKN